jgi:hypothetical protein
MGRGAAAGRTALPIRAADRQDCGLATELLRSRATQALRRCEREADVNAEAPARYLAISARAGRTVIEFHDEPADALAMILTYSRTAQAHEALFDLGEPVRALRLNASPRWTPAPAVRSSKPAQVALAAAILARHDAVPRTPPDAYARGRDLLLLTELPETAPTFEFHPTRAAARARSFCRSIRSQHGRRRARCAIRARHRSGGWAGSRPRVTRSVSSASLVLLACITRSPLARPSSLD